MAAPLTTAKKSVDLASDGPRVSRIRRDPPPPEKPKKLRHPDVVNRQDVVIGVLAFALALCVIIFAVASYNGWSPAQYTVHVDLS